MLKSNRRTAAKKAHSRFAIVASRYNAKYVEGMLRAAKRVLLAAGAEVVTVVRVPGAFEVPVVAARLAGARQPAYGAILCFGVILRGETSHADHIGEAVSHALAQIQVGHGIPIIHEVLLFTNEAQARVRCLGVKHNRGIEAAQTALAMAEVMAELPAATAR